MRREVHRARYRQCGLLSMLSCRMLRQGKLSPQVSTHRRRSSATTRAGGCSDSDRVILRSALRGSPRSSPQAEPDEAAMPQPPTCSRCVWPVIRGIARVESSHARIFEMTAEPSLGDSHWHQRRKSTGTGSSLDNGSIKGATGRQATSQNCTRAGSFSSGL